MDPLHIHLLLNHFPVVGTVIGIATLLIGFASRSEAIKRVSLVIVLGTALLTIPVYLTGEPAEETVENSVGVSKPLMEEHEEAAEPAFIAMGVLGVIALGALLISFRAGKYANFSFAATFIVSLVAFGLIARTANLGGQIRHAEIRSGASASNNETESKQKDRERDNDDD